MISVYRHHASPHRGSETEMLMCDDCYARMSVNVWLWSWVHNQLQNFWWRFLNAFHRNSLIFIVEWTDPRLHCKFETLLSAFLLQLEKKKLLWAALPFNHGFFNSQLPSQRHPHPPCDDELYLHFSWIYDKLTACKAIACFLRNAKTCQWISQQITHHSHSEGIIVI